jgi:naphthalene 1,2-dioxygenase system ferredoxin subunit
VQVGGREVALYRVGDEVFATDNLCTHGMARLCDGWLDGFLIECPLHQGLFDVRTGACAGDPVEIDVATYPVRISDGQVELELPHDQPLDKQEQA